MKALVLEKYNDLKFEDVPEPKLGPDDVLVEVKACGICGSDVHGMDGSTGRRIPPLIMGHEASGVIAAVGANVSGWQKGERVTFDSTVYCGNCYYCHQGLFNLCDNRRVLGVATGEYKQNGAFAQYVAMPPRIVYRLPASLPFSRAAMTEPVSVAMHAVSLAPVSGNDTGVVVGAGMIGLLVVQALKAAGCGRILAVDIDPDKLDLACTLGADEGLRSDQGDVAAEVAKRTGGHGADLAYEVVGITPTLKIAVNSLKKGGSLVLVGNVSPTVELPLQAVVSRQLTLHGSAASCGEYPACLAAIENGTINVDVLISAIVPLSEGASWFGRLHAREPGLMKVILEP